MTKKELLEMIDFIDDDKQIVVLSHIVEIDELTITISNELDRCENAILSMQKPSVE